MGAGPLRERLLFTLGVLLDPDWYFLTLEGDENGLVLSEIEDLRRR